MTLVLIGPNCGERLQILIRTEGLLDLPFELLYYSEFLVPSRVHLMYRVSDWGRTKEPKPRNRSLEIFYIVCSPGSIYSILDFEKEEETILTQQVSRKLPVLSPPSKDQRWDQVLIYCQREHEQLPGIHPCTSRCGCIPCTFQECSSEKPLTYSEFS